MAFSLDAFPDGNVVFLDANVFLLHYWGRSASCSRLIERIETGVIQGATSTTVLSEVTHRLLITEAISHRPTIVRHPIRYLKHHPALVRSLTHTHLLLDRMTRLPLRVLTLTPLLWHHATRISHTLGLLMNDAITVDCLRRLRLRHLASADKDFRKIPRLTIWTP